MKIGFKGAIQLLVRILLLIMERTTRGLTIALQTQGLRWQPAFVHLYAQGQRDIRLVQEQHQHQLQQMQEDGLILLQQIIMEAFRVEVELTYYILSNKMIMHTAFNITFLMPFI